MVDGLEDEIINFNGTLVLKTDFHLLESISQTLSTYTYGSVFHI